jgi:hypothetical protein
MVIAWSPRGRDHRTAKVNDGLMPNLRTGLFSQRSTVQMSWRQPKHLLAIDRV